MINRSAGLVDPFVGLRGAPAGVDDRDGVGMPPHQYVDRVRNGSPHLVGGHPERLFTSRLLKLLEQYWPGGEVHVELNTGLTQIVLEEQDEGLPVVQVHGGHLQREAASITRLGQQLFGAFHVCLDPRQVGRELGPEITRQRPVDAAGVTTEAIVNRGIVVKQHGDCPAHSNVLGRPIVHIESELIDQGRWRCVEHEIGLAFELIGDINGQDVSGDVNLALFQHQADRGVLLDDTVDYPVNVFPSPTAPIVGKPLVNEFLVMLPRLEHKRARATFVLHRMVLGPVTRCLLVSFDPSRGRPHIDATLASQNSQKGRVDLFQMDPGRMIVDNFNVPYTLPVLGRSAVDTHDALPRKTDGPGVEIGPIVEFDALTEVKGVGQAVIGNLP